MFEQSILLPSGTAKRGRALAASLALQTGGLSLLLLIPLVYHDQLPFMHPALPVLLPPVPMPVPEMPMTKEPADATTHHSALPFRPTFNPDALRAGNAPRMIPEIGGPLVEFDPTQQDLVIQLDFAALPIPPPPPKFEKTVPSPSVPVAPIRVPSDVQAAKLIRKVVPEYPSLAKMIRISGTVRLTGTIGKNGTVEQLQVIGGHPLLVKAAIDAVRQWLYQPTILNGSTVEVITSIDVVFTLAQ